ncbi:MAG: hypothetical protein R3D70_10580 [Rhizobiaceae bacterium]
MRRPSSSGGGGSGAAATRRFGAPCAALAVAMDAVAMRLIDCFPICDADQTSEEAAKAWFQDFKLSTNVVGMYPAAVVNIGAGNVTRP